MDKKLDLTKPIRDKVTKRPARVICTDRKSNSFPIILLLTYPNGQEAVNYLNWSTLEGQYENVPEKKVITMCLVKGHFSGDIYILPEEYVTDAYRVLDRKVIEFDIPPGAQS